jgi:hypothetical protein
MKSRKVFQEIVGISLIGLILTACNLSHRHQMSSMATATTQSVNMVSLTDGQYQICTEPFSQNQPSAYGWCFFFWKEGEKVTGWYTYWQPSDYARICIEGLIEVDRVIGKGYELIESWDKPVTNTDIAFIVERIAKEKGMWDNWNETGKNLRVSHASLYQQGRDSRGYYAWIEYQKVELELSGFYRRNTEKTTFSRKCVDLTSNISIK